MKKEENESYVYIYMFQLKQDRDQSSFFAFYLECPRSFTGRFAAGKLSGH